MLERGAIDDSIDRNDASLGVSIEDVGDGVRIKSFVLKSAARAAGLRVGDVIIEVDRAPVRNQDEMRLVVARLKVGETISVRYRRDGAEHAIDVTPRPLGR
jgi:regulator of sigma E protease